MTAIFLPAGSGKMPFAFFNKTVDAEESDRAIFTDSSVVALFCSLRQSQACVSQYDASSECATARQHKVAEVAYYRPREDIDGVRRTTHQCP